MSTIERLAKPVFTDREWGEAKMFGQYENRDEGEVVVFRRIDLCAYVTMIRQYDAEIAPSAAEYAALERRNAELVEALTSGLADICGAKLCSINSMSSRAEMERLMTNAADTLRAALAHSAQEKTDAAE